MKNKKVVTVLGARPQFVKAGVVSRALEEAGGVDEVVVHTGQHFDTNMSDVFFSELGMEPPAYNLGIRGGGHGFMTGRMMMELETVFQDEAPDAVLVYGDTNSTLAAALAAVKLHIPVAHVEAGLRSYNHAMPEEINRIVTDRVSRWLFAPTSEAVSNLRREGYQSEQVMQVGDVMLDVALHHGARVSAEDPILRDRSLRPNEYVLATVHRAENTDTPERLGAITQGLLRVAEDMRVVWPVHPRAREALSRFGLLTEVEATLETLEPVGYLDMVGLEKHAAVIVTDSGGVQKEAFFHETPCVTVREETEWVELVQAGWNRLVSPSDSGAIAGAVRDATGTRGEAVTPYGDGHAAREIARHLKAAL